MLGLKFETGAACDDWQNFIASSVRHFSKKFGEPPKVLACNPSVAPLVLSALVNLGLATSIELVPDFETGNFHMIVLGRAR
jgi:hypothetical protein